VYVVARAKRPRRDVPITAVFSSVTEDDPVWISIRSVVSSCHFDQLELMQSAAKRELHCR